MRKRHQSSTTDDQKLENLIELAFVLNQQNDFEEILRVVAHKTADDLNADCAIILMINPRTRQTVKTIHREGSHPHEPHYQFVQNQISGWILHNNQSILSANIKTDHRFHPRVFKKMPINSVMGVPLRIEGVIIGTLLLLNKNIKKKFSEPDLSYLEKIAVIAVPYLRNVQKIQQYFDTPLPKPALLARYEEMGLFGKSTKFLQMLQSMEAAARCDVRVMLIGQSGTGKELVARAIHHFSSRNQRPFLAIDCGAIPENLLESELFGYEKGAFTGANQTRTGLIEATNGGTLFIDEVANLPLEMQSKLMRVLQENEIRPLGSNKTRKIDVRIISASSCSLRELVSKNLFREDLFYRLHVYPIYIPKLSERRQDIPLLANHFLKKIAKHQNKKAELFHEKILDFMKQLPWPGNVRELENLVERLVTLAPPRCLTIDHEVIPPDVRTDFNKFLFTYESSPETPSLKERLLECEKQILREALTENNWNQSKAARSLKMSEQNFRYRMKKFGIKRPDNLQ